MRELLIALLIVLILGFGIAFYARLSYVKKREKELDGNKIVKKKKKQLISQKSWIRLYRAFLIVPFCKQYLSAAYQQFEILVPGDRNKIMQETAKSFVKTWGTAFVLTVILIVVRPGWYWVGAFGILIYIANDWSLNSRTAKLSESLLKALAEFIERVRHEYYRCRIIDTAIEEAANLTPSPMRGHADKILEVIRAYDVDLALAEYNETVPNGYLKTFTAVAVSLMQNGDKKVEGQSLFLSSLTNLKREISKELLYRRKKKDAFSGTTFVNVLPMFATTGIATWAMGSLTSLETFYGGGMGILIPSVTLVLTILCYYLLNKLKSLEHVSVINQGALFSRVLKVKPLQIVTHGLAKRNRKKAMKKEALLRRVGSNLTLTQFYAQRVFFFVITFIICFVMLLTMHYADKSVFLMQSGDVKAINGATRDQKAEFTVFVNDYMADIAGKQITDEEIEEAVVAALELNNDSLIEALVKVIRERVDGYNAEFFRWYELLISIAVAILAFYVPQFLLLYKRKLIMLGMNEEIVQFQAIIVMLMHLKNMTAEIVLQWLETFAVIFRPAISECLSNYSFGEKQALENLKAAEGYEQFERIVQNLEIADSVGIEAAFEEIVATREAFQEDIQLDAEILLRKKATLAKAISFVPGAFLIITYLIIPFIVESMSGLSFDMKL